MKKLKKVIIVFSTFIIIMLATTTTANAAIDYYHGNIPSKYLAGGRIESTTKQNSMRVDTAWRDYWGTNRGTYTGSVYYNQKRAENYLNLKGETGSTYCLYYVNNVNKHNSTAWFNFDFSFITR